MVSYQVKKEIMVTVVLVPGQRYLNHKTPESKQEHKDKLFLFEG